MPSLFLLTAISVATLSSIGFTYLVRHYALRKQLLDMPNERSSHTTPTPRGGGLAIVITFLLSLLGLSFWGHLDWPTSLGFIIAGGLIAAIGFWDDRGHVTPKWRLLVHFLAASLLVYTTGGLPSLIFFGVPISFGVIGHGLAIIAVVWILNLFNFMDGIDGIASVEAISALGVLALLCFPMNSTSAAINALLGAAVLGFLVWNFPPAKIFMGDAGSGFLGLMLAGLLLWNTHMSPTLFWSWLIMLGVFVVDATLTLLRRLLQKKKVYEAHRSHAYQHATHHVGAHKPVTLTVLAINLLWLAPWAYLAGTGIVDGFLALIIAYIPLVLLAFRWKAGYASSVYQKE